MWSELAKEYKSAAGSHEERLGVPEKEGQLQSSAHVLTLVTK